MAYRPLQRSELTAVLNWAAREGWEPGLRDADAFWAADPAGFLGVESEDGLIASGAIVAYPGSAGRPGCGFMGLFIVDPQHRGRGVGRDFWYYRRDLLRSRLGPDAPIQMDGVLAMEPFYARGGFRRLHYDIRMSGTVQSPDVCASDVSDAHDVRFEDLQAYDQRCSGLSRPRFLEAWLSDPASLSLVALDDLEVIGFGSIRKTAGTAKVGPLFANSAQVAQDLLAALAEGFGGQSLSLDVPEVNDAAMRLARNAGLAEKFRCARMVYGPDPVLDWRYTFGVTTFEIG